MVLDARARVRDDESSSCLEVLLYSGRVIIWFEAARGSIVLWCFESPPWAHVRSGAAEVTPLAPLRRSVDGVWLLASLALSSNI